MKKKTTMQRANQSSNQGSEKAIGILEDFSLYSKSGEAMMRSLKELNFNVEKEYVFNKS